MAEERLAVDRFNQIRNKLGDSIRRREIVGAVAQLGERRFCKPEVVGSIPISSTNSEKSGE